MSKYTREEQIQIVQWAMNLTATINSEKDQIDEISSDEFRMKPLPPTHQKAQTVKPNYPSPQKSNYTFSEHIKKDASFIAKLFTKKGIIAAIAVLVGGNVLGAILEALGYKVSLFFYLGVLLHIVSALIIPAYGVMAIIKYVEYSQKRREYNKQLENTPEYLEARAEAEKIAKEQEQANQNELDIQYKKAMVEYNSSVEVYKKELAEYEKKKEIELSILNQDLSENVKTLRELYEATHLIPNTVRALNELIWIYDDMSSSEHDFERALDMLIANKQLAKQADILNQMNNMTTVMYQGFSEVLNGIDYNNYQLDEINNNLGKVRRDINIGNVAAVSQRHKMNKNIGSTNAKLDEMLKR